MVQLGQYNELEVVKHVDFGAYLDGGDEYGEILLPLRYVPEGLKPKDMINVFIHTDSEDRVIATTEQPKAVVGDIAFLEVVSMSRFGVFLDWGLPKDLLLPSGEQVGELQIGESCLVSVYLDKKTNRVAASQKIDKHIKKTEPNYKPGEEVDLVIIRETDLGFSAVINGTHIGLLYANEIFETLSPGEEGKGYIRRVREDGKIDLTLIKPGYEKVDSISQNILDRLKTEGGFLPLTDKTEPDTIYRELKMSKKTFKKAIGALYKKKLIKLEDDGIRLVP